jgi:hypothetical protein
MNRRATPSDRLSVEADVEHDLLAALLPAEGISCSGTLDVSLTEAMITAAEIPDARIAYPWNPAQAEDFFTQSEQPTIFADWQAEEILQRSTQFFAKLDSLWSGATLQNLLVERFGVRMPQPLLTAIAHRAQTITTTSLSLADQLVQCVQDVLPALTGLVEDDLYVIGRPLAESMRDGSPAIESTLSAVRSLDWQDLSEVEQARLSLVVARYALQQLETLEP